MTDYFLSSGGHPDPNEGRCAMEWVAYLAGEKHSDQPACVSPMLTVFCIALNDSMNDIERQKLRPYLARTIGTHGDGLDKQRMWMCADWLIRTYTPAWLDRAGLVGPSWQLRSLAPVLAIENLEQVVVNLQFARKQAVALWHRADWWYRADIASRIASATAKAAASAACATTNALAIPVDAEQVARTAARAAAKDTAFALTPIAVELQQYTFDLLDRMLPTEIIQLPVVEDAEAVCGIPITTCRRPSYV